MAMPLYVYQGTYTAESLAAQIREPQDRLEAVQPAFEAIGGKIVAHGYPFGERNVLVVVDVPRRHPEPGFALAVAAAGGVDPVSIRLVNGQDGWNPCARRRPRLPARRWRLGAANAQAAAELLGLTGRLDSSRLSASQAADSTGFTESSSWKMGISRPETGKKSPGIWENTS